MPEYTVEVPAIGVFALDRITTIREGDAPEQQVDWHVTHRHSDLHCPEHGVRHARIDYTEPDGSEGARDGFHCFEVPDTWLTVHRSYSDGPPAGAPAPVELAEAS